MSEVTTDGKRDVKNILEVIQAIFSVLKKFSETLADGYQPSDILELLRWAWADEKFHGELKLAIDDIKSIPLEALDLKISEIVMIFNVCKTNMEELGFSFENGKFGTVFGILKKIYDLIKKFI